jgi:hypothetical protein
VDQADHREVEGIDERQDIARESLDREGYIAGR